METHDVPEDFPRSTIPAVVPGTQPKTCAIYSGGIYVAGQTAQERYERWLICEDLASQLVPIARKDAVAHPNYLPSQTLQRVRGAVARKGWVSPDELAWIERRLRALLGW